MKKIISCLLVSIILIAACCIIYHFVVSTHNSTTKVIAHRGYWNKEGSAQNSITALQAASEIDIYGSEFDVQMTADKELIVIHDLHIDSIEYIRKASYSSIKNYQLSNGESVPLLSVYLDSGADLDDCKLILEIKSHLSPELETEMVCKILDMVANKNLQDRVEYIAFSQHVCREIVRLNPFASVAYLSGDITPKQACEYGFSGLDYHYSKYIDNPGWIQEAHDLGITVNVWTVNEEKDILNMLNSGVDFITTDVPELVQQLIARHN